MKSSSGQASRKGKVPAEAGEEAAGVGVLELVLPDAEDGPVAGSEGASDEAVAGAVGGDLLSPEGGVGFGLGGVERAALPETAVDEDGEFARAEDEVGSDAEGFWFREFGWLAKRRASLTTLDAVDAAVCHERKLDSRN